MTRGLTIILIAICFNALGQVTKPEEKKATIHLTNISLGKALNVLGISYGVEFSYSDDVVPSETIIDLSIEDQGLESALSEVLSPFALTFKRSGNNRIILKRLNTASTQNVRGRVSDQVTGIGIEGSSITVLANGKQYISVSDSRGEFVVSKVPVGRVAVNVTSIGYETFGLSGMLLDAGKEAVIEVKLPESVTAMHEVEITALKNDGIAGDGVALTSGHSFTVEQTKRYAGSFGDPARMVSVYASITGASDENNALIVRGNSPRGVLWRLDGVEIPNPNHFATEGASGGVVSVLSANMLDRSDFLAGAFPAQYGNALSAVFDMRLRNGNNNKREYSLQTGLLGVEVSAEGPFNKTKSGSYLANYRYSTLSLLDKLGFDLNTAGQYKDYQDVAFKLHQPLGTTGSLSLFGIGGKSKSNTVNIDVFDDNRSDVGVVGLTSKHIIGANTVLNSALSFSKTAISRSNDTDVSDSDSLTLEEYYSKSYIRAQVSGRRKISSKFYAEGGFTISRLNYDFYLRSVDPRNQAYRVIVNFQERDHTYITQAFLYARQYISPRVFGFYGSHFLHFALTRDYAIEPRAGIRWQSSENSSVSFGYGKHGRIENLQYYLGRDHQAGGNEIQINKELGFTRADHLNVSYEQQLSSSLRFKTEVYFQQLYNAPVHANPSALYTTINEDTGFITDSLINKGKGRNYGVEFSFERSFSNNWYAIANVSLFRSTFDIGEKQQLNTVYNGNACAHIAGGKEFEMNDQSRLGVNIKITTAGGRRYVPIDLQRSILEGRAMYDWQQAFENKLPTYFRTDFQIVYQVNRARHSFEYRLDIQNVTDHRNAAYYYYDKQHETIRLKKQYGFIPLLTFRIGF
jgi:hypothetical protein